MCEYKYSDQEKKKKTVAMGHSGSHHLSSRHNYQKFLDEDDGPVVFYEGSLRISGLPTKVPHTLERAVIKVLKDGFPTEKVPKRLWGIGHIQWFVVDRVGHSTSEPVEQVLAVFSWDAGGNQIDNFAVAKECRRQGIGSSVLRAFKNYNGAPFNINVETKNKAALNFYNKNGFIRQTLSTNPSNATKIVTMVSPA